MKRIYKGKSKLRILIDTKCDLSGYQTVMIAALKPNGTPVLFPAVVKDVEKGLIFYKSSLLPNRSHQYRHKDTKDTFLQ